MADIHKKRVIEEAILAKESKVGDTLIKKMGQKENLIRNLFIRKYIPL